MGALNESFMRRSRRVRDTLKRAANGRARLSVFRSSKHIYAQVIDDSAGKTVAAASTLDKDLKGSSAQGQRPRGGDRRRQAVAERALQAGVKDVVFDRGGYLYHGRVKALAEAAREAGLNF